MMKPSSSPGLAERLRWVGLGEHGFISRVLCRPDPKLTGIDEVSFVSSLTCIAGPVEAEPEERNINGRERTSIWFLCLCLPWGRDLSLV